MVTSKLMRRAVPILLALFLLTGGLCSGLCFVQAAHSCCQEEKDHCGHAAPVLQSHQAIAISQIAPVILTTPVAVSPVWLMASHSVVQLRLIDFSPPLRTSILRL
jgi:hypothetical protein